MAQSAEACVIGRGITIKGTVRGREDVVLEGALEGRVELESHLLVETSGRVNAAVVARSCAVAGTLQGQVTAEAIALHQGSVVGAELTAPRIIIEDGAHFTGAIHMDVLLPEDL